MLKRYNLSFLFVGATFSLFANNQGDIARGDSRGGGNHDSNRSHYDRYENHHYNPNAYYNRYDQNRWGDDHNNVNVYSEGIYDGVLLNNPYNPDVEYTQPGSTDNFNEVYEENLK